MRALVTAVAIVALVVPGLGQAETSSHAHGARPAARVSHRARARVVRLAAAAPAPPPAPAPGGAPAPPPAPPPPAAAPAAPPAPPPAAAPSAPLPSAPRAVPAPPPPSGGTTAPAPRPPGAPAPRPSAPYRAPSAHPTFPAPGPYRPGGVYRHPYGYYPYYPYYYPYYGFAPFSFGFDFGYDPYYSYYQYYPYYPDYPYYSDEPYNPSAPYYGQPLYQQPAYAAPQITTEMDLHGAGTDGGAAAGVSIAIESRRFGFHAAVDGFYLDRLYGSRYFGANGTLGAASLHGTFSILSADAYRLRLEAGGSFLSWPDTFVSAGAVAVGPDVGISGRVRLAGPLGILAHARYTPVPVAAVDALGALALQFGNLAFTGGWRQISVDRHEVVPRVEFGGPQFGLTLLF